MRKSHQRSWSYHGLTRAFLVACLLVSATAAADEGNEDIVRVSFEKTLLDTPAGIEKLHRKLQARAGKECVRSSTLSVKEGTMCLREMVSQFLAGVNNLQLTHYVETGQHLNQQTASTH